MSFEHTYRQLFADLHQYAFTITKDEEWSADMVQDAFIKYYQQLEAGAQIEHPKAYLYRIVHNTTISQLRKKASLAKHEAAVADNTIVENTILESTINKEQDNEKLALMQNVLDSMPEQCRLVFTKSRAEGKKYREIAEELNLSVKTVEAHISKALKIIQDFVRVNRDKLSLIQIVMLYELFV